MSCSEYDAMHQQGGEGSHPKFSWQHALSTASHDSSLTTAAKTIKARYEIRPPIREHEKFIYRWEREGLGFLLCW